MNWNGGYKNRFRLRSEVHSRKNTFQQQSRIMLVDDIGIKELKQTSPISNKKLLASPSVNNTIGLMNAMSIFIYVINLFRWKNQKLKLQ